MQAERAAHAKVVRVYQEVVDFDLLAFYADVSDPVLAATVGASRYVQFQVLIETGQPLFQFFHQPAREALGLSNSEFAEFRTAAGYGSTGECRSSYSQTNGIE